MNRRVKTGAITEGAILAAVGALIALIGYYIPFLTIALTLWAAPIIICGYRNGLKVSIISTVVASLLVGMLVSPMVAINLFITYGIPGIAMGYLMQKKKAAGLTVSVGAVLVVIGLVVTVIIGFYMMGMDITSGIADITQQIQGIIGNMKPQMMEMYTQFGMTTEAIEAMFQQVELMIETLKMMMPVILMSCGLIYAYANYKLANVVLKRTGVETPDLTPFVQWRLPNNFAIGMFVSFAIIFVCAYFKIPGIDVAMLNIFMIIMYAYSVIGFAVVAFYLQKTKVPRGLRILIMGIVFLFLSRLLFFIGLADIVFNIRQKITEK